MSSAVAPRPTPPAPPAALAPPCTAGPSLMLTPLAAAAGPSLMLTPLAAAGPSLMWPYTMGGPGCALCCGRPPLVVLTMVGAGLGLPLSEELLVLGIGAALPGLSGSRRLCTLVWLLVGVVASDLATVSLGTLLRRNSASLRAQAPRFGGRLLASIGRQLSVEGRRDARRLERQLSYRLQSTARSASELLALLSRAADQPGAGEPPPPLPPLPGPLQLTLLRRATCNTRTALATAEQVMWPEPELVRTPEPVPFLKPRRATNTAHITTLGRRALAYCACSQALRRAAWPASSCRNMREAPTLCPCARAIPNHPLPHPRSRLAPPPPPPLPLPLPRPRPRPRP